MRLTPEPDCTLNMESLNYTRTCVCNQGAVHNEEEAARGAAGTRRGGDAGGCKSDLPNCGQRLI